jgi:hypothetical protein
LLSLEQIGSLFVKINDYNKNPNNPMGSGLLEEDKIVQIAFAGLKKTLDKDTEKYKAIVDRNIEN